MSQSIEEIMSELSLAQQDEESLLSDLAAPDPLDAVGGVEKSHLCIVPETPRTGRPRHMEPNVNTSVYLSDFAYTLVKKVSEKLSMTKKQIVEAVVRVLLAQLRKHVGYVAAQKPNMLPPNQQRGTGGGYVSIDTELHRLLDRYGIQLGRSHANMVSEACEKALPAYLLIPPLF